MNQLTNDINLIASYLAKRDIPTLSKASLDKRYGISQADILILMGGSIPYGCEKAAEAYLHGIAKHFMIVGGVGHTTEHLRSAISKRHPTIKTRGRTEADIIADLFEKQYGIKKKELIIENSSTNCGENATYAMNLIREHGLCPQNILLMQDSSMQLRMDATFRKEHTGSICNFINYAAYIPRITERDGELEYVENDIWGLWEMKHFLSLIMGEIPRLHDTVGGYGPLGKGFIVHVDIPDEVITSFERLSHGYGHLVRKAIHVEQGQM